VEAKSSGWQSRTMTTRNSKEINRPSLSFPRKLRDRQTPEFAPNITAGYRQIQQHLGLRQGGVRAFFAPPKRYAGHKLTAEVSQQAQGLLNEGLESTKLSGQLSAEVGSGGLLEGSRRMPSSPVLEDSPGVLKVEQTLAPPIGSRIEPRRV